MYPAALKLSTKLDLYTEQNIFVLITSNKLYKRHGNEVYLLVRHNEASCPIN